MKIVKLLTIFSVSLFIWSSCETKKDKSTDANDSTVQKYECPMHSDVIGKQGDTCPKCGMKLTKIHEEKESSQYKMEFKAEPAVEAGKSAKLSFTPTMIDHEQDSVPLDIQHDKKIHLIVVSKDLSYFDPSIRNDRRTDLLKSRYWPQVKNTQRRSFKTKPTLIKGATMYCSQIIFPLAATISWKELN